MANELEVDTAGLGIAAADSEAVAAALTTGSADGVRNAMNEVSYAMAQFFGGNFHTDWDLEADDWPQIVDNFVVGERPRQLYSLARDIDEFRNGGQEHELHAAMLRMGGFYDPRPDMTYRS